MIPVVSVIAYTGIVDGHGNGQNMSIRLLALPVLYFHPGSCQVRLQVFIGDFNMEKTGWLR